MRATARRYETAADEGAPLEAEVTVSQGDSAIRASGVTVEVGWGPVGQEPDDTWTWVGSAPAGADRWLDTFTAPKSWAAFALGCAAASADGGRTAPGR